MDFTVKKGDIVITRDGRERTVKKADGRFIYFTDGSAFGLRHPDIMEVRSPKKKKESKNDTEE